MGDLNKFLPPLRFVVVLELLAHSPLDFRVEFLCVVWHDPS
jgi:hypothetical protein